MERDDATRRSAGHWWYASIGAAVCALAVALIATGHSWWLVLNAALGVAMTLSFRHFTATQPQAARPAAQGRLARLDERLMVRFSRPRRRPLNRLERWLQQLDDSYAPLAYRRDPRN